MVILSQEERDELVELIDLQNSDDDAVMTWADFEALLFLLQKLLPTRQIWPGIPA